MTVTTMKILVAKFMASRDRLEVRVENCCYNLEYALRVC